MKHLDHNHKSLQITQKEQKYYKLEMKPYNVTKYYTDK